MNPKPSVRPIKGVDRNPDINIAERSPVRRPPLAPSKRRKCIWQLRCGCGQERQRAPRRMFCEEIASMQRNIAIAKASPLIPDHVRPIFNIVSIRHMKEVKMPSPRKAPPSHAAETEMPSRKKEVAAPSKSLGKTQGQKGAQVAQRTKSKPKA